MSDNQAQSSMATHTEVAMRGSKTGTSIPSETSGIGRNLHNAAPAMHVGDGYNERSIQTPEAGQSAKQGPKRKR